MNNIDQYIKLCDIVDQILIDTGIRELCARCCIKNERCCVGCKYLGKSGCTSTVLGCKLWLCFKESHKYGGDYENKRNMQRVMVKKYPHFIQLLKQIYDIGNKNHWIGSRQGVEDIKKGKKLFHESFKEGYYYLGVRRFCGGYYHSLGNLNK